MQFRAKAFFRMFAQGNQIVASFDARVVSIPGINLLSVSFVFSVCASML